MVYDETLARRVRQVLNRRKGVNEKKMFGGLCFLLNGNMCCGVESTLLVLRLGDDAVEQALQQPHTRAMDFTGKPMKSMVYVEPQGTDNPKDLKQWIDQAVKFVRTLPEK